jgi:hypothetical protein
MIYLLLFGLSFANDYFLTKYYICVAEGKRWYCAGLSLCQQLCAMSAVCFNLVDVEPLSRDQFTRWAVTAVAYATAALFSVKEKR